MDSPRPKETLRRWLLALGCFALLLFFFSPSWAAFHAWSRTPELQGMIEVRRGANVLYQIDHLGAPVPDPLHAAIQWRLLFPVIGRALHLSPARFFALAHVGGVLVLGFVISLLRGRRWNWFESALGALALGAAGWFFAGTGWLGYFDAWVVLALLFVAFAQRSWPVWLACAWAPWIDERFVLGAPLALACRWIYFSRPIKREALVAGALLAVFLVIRLGVLPAKSAAGATVSGYLGNLNALEAPLGRIALGTWEGLRMGWLFVVVAGAVLWRQRPSVGAALMAGTAVVVAIGLATAQDFARSMMFIVPVAALGLVHAREAAVQWLPRALRVGAVATLLLPAHHVMSDAVVPIYYVYHALSAFGTPPRYAMPEYHELLGIRAMQEGRLVEAAEALSLAIKLSPNPAGPAKQRGALFASQQKWAEARQDFSLMVEHAPNNPDGWFLRAQAALALGDVRAAESDWQQAIALAPKGWRERGDVARFEARLKQAAK